MLSSTPTNQQWFLREGWGILILFPICDEMIMTITQRNHVTPCTDNPSIHELNGHVISRRCHFFSADFPNPLFLTFFQPPFLCYRPSLRRVMLLPCLEQVLHLTSLHFTYSHLTLKILVLIARARAHFKSDINKGYHFCIFGWYPQDCERGANHETAPSSSS